MGIQGKTVVFTGKISQPRHAFQKMVEDHGGIAGSDITKATNYLVVGEKPGSKLFRATSLGIQTISEGEFLKLLEDKEDEEAPLSFAELQEVESAREERTCAYCGRIYKQWKKLPNHDTCPICEILSKVVCPHCDDDPTLITDFGLYHCMTCGSWFKAPISAHARTSKHHHFFIQTKETSEGIYEACVACGHTIFLTHEVHAECEASRKDHYENAPMWVKQKRIEEEESIKQGQREAEAWKFLESLSPSQIYLLQEQLSK